jgi:DNA replication protein DnaD
MARPKKIGLEYFPMDVDMDQDDKIYLIKADHGWEGFAVVIKLLMEIYGGEGYYIGWDEKKAKIFSRKNLFDLDVVNAVINSCLEEHFFNKKLFEGHEILSSAGIQKRYMEATSRRKEVEVDGRFLLIDINEINNSNLRVVNVNNNSIQEEENDNDNPQSKVKESKEKEKELQEEEEDKHRPNLYETFRFSFNYEPTPAQIDLLGSYIDQDGMEEELVLWILKEVGQLGKDFAYAKGWLNRSVSKSILTLSEAIKANEEHERKKQQSQANSNVRPFRQPNGPVREAPDWLKENSTSGPEVNLNPRTEEENAQWLEELLSGKGGS